MAKEDKNPEEDLEEGVNPDQDPEDAGEDTEELKNKISELQVQKDNLVGELKDDRNKRQELQKQIDDLKQSLEDSVKASVNPEDNRIEEKISEILQKREKQDAVKNKETAFQQFISENKEFHSDNDPSGLKMDALKEKLSRFNTDNVITVEDHLSIIKDAYNLLSMNKPAEGPQSQNNPYSSTTQTTSTPSVVDKSVLSDKEQKLINQNGWTEERLLNMKKSMPDYVDKLLEYVK